MIFELVLSERARSTTPVLREGVYKLRTGPGPRTVYDLRARSETDHDATQLQTTCIDQQLQNYIGTGRVIL